MTLPTRLICIEGNPKDRGLSYGSSAKDLIHRNIEIYKVLYRRFAGLEWESVKAEAEKWIPIVRKYDGEIMDEIEGIAAGAECSVEEIVALNARYEFSITTLSRRSRRECTAFAVTPDSSLTDDTILGQNWDFRSRFRDTCILLNIRQEGGKPDILMHLEAGTVGHKGLNSSGLGLCINALLADSDRVEAGVPLVSVVARKILNSNTLRDAVHAVMRAERSASINYLIAHSGGEALNLEVTSDDVAILHPEGGVLTHSNNFLWPNFTFRDLGKSVFPDSPVRWNRMRRLLMRRKKLNVNSVRAVVSDHFDYPNSICRHPDSRAHPDDQFETITSVLMFLEEGKFYFTEGAPCKGKYKLLTVKKRS
ncbi:MAG: C45 family autoproteolytic acyltransferase/hydrolase [Candidatus Bathyarchaeia archaeon]